MIVYELVREAEDELQAAAARYEARVPGLGLEFVDEVERAMNFAASGLGHRAARMRRADARAAE